MRQHFRSIDDFRKDPYSQILAYPKPTKKKVESRIIELKKIGISSISFQGHTQVGTVNVLGKGYVGIVVAAKKNNKLFALKIRRVDSPRKDMKDESKLLQFANSVGVGPKLYQNSRNFILMEFLKGEKIGDWIKTVHGKGSAVKVKSIIRKVLEDCFNLDNIGFDHGELSSITKHVIIGKKTTLIDFESSSVKRKVANVTSATQAFYIGSGISKKIKRICRIPTKNRMIKALRRYKHDRSKESFENLLTILKLKIV